MEYKNCTTIFFNQANKNHWNLLLYWCDCVLIIYTNSKRLSIVILSNNILEKIFNFVLKIFLIVVLWWRNKSKNNFLWSSELVQEFSSLSNRFYILFNMLDKQSGIKKRSWILYCRICKEFGFYNWFSRILPEHSSSKNECQNKQNEKNPKENFCNGGSTGGDSTKTQYGCYNCNYYENNGPSKHDNKFLVQFILLKDVPEFW